MVQPHCIVSHLDPPITVDGLLCSVVIKFIPPGSPTVRNEAIISGVVEAVSTIGGFDPELPARTYDVTCEKDWQYSNTTVIIGPGNSYELVYPVWAGGNVCWTAEPERVQGFSNPLCYRGDDLDSKLREGMRVAFDMGDHTRSGLCLFTKAYGRPSVGGVNWRGDGSTAADNVITYVNIDSLPAIKPVMEEFGGASNEFFLPSTTRDIDLYAASGILWIDLAGPTEGYSERVIFQNPTTFLDDADYAPPGMTFDQVDPQYWINPHTHEVRISWSHKAISDGVQLRYYERGSFQYTNVEWFLPMVLDLSPHTVFEPGTGGDTGDRLMMAYVETRGDFIFGDTDTAELTAVQFGAGSWIWRAVGDVGAHNRAGARGVRLDFDGTALTGCFYRQVVDGPWISTLLTDTAMGANFFIYVTRVGVQFKIYTCAGPTFTSWTLQATINVSLLEPLRTGMAGFAGGHGDGLRVNGIRLKDWVAYPVSRIYVGATEDDVEDLSLGKMGVFRFLSFDMGDFEQVASEAYTDDIVEIYNQTANVAMTDGGDRGRGSYRTVGDTRVFPVECAQDTIRITYEPPASVPAGTGVPPRVFNQTNLGTVQAGNPFGHATTNVNQNRGNWSDYFHVRDEAGDIAIVPGMAFEAFADAVFHPDFPPTIRYDQQQAPIEDASWPTLAPEKYRIRCVEGLVFLSEEFEEECIATGLKTCISPQGMIFSWRDPFSAPVLEEITSCIAVLGELFYSVSLGSGVPLAVSGTCAGIYPWPTAWACHASGNWIGTAYAWGLKEKDFLGGVETFGPWPFRTLEVGALTYWDSTSRPDIPSPDIIVTCGLDTRSQYDICLPMELLTFVCPFNGGATPPVRAHWSRENRVASGGVVISDDPAPLMINFCGAYPDVGGCFAVTQYAAAFSYESVPISIPSPWKKKLDDVVIDEAYARVKFTGMRSIEWEADVMLSGPASGASLPNYAFHYYEQGHLISGYTRVAGVETENFFDAVFPEPIQGGNVNFILVGVKKNSETVILSNGDEFLAPSHTVHSLGASIAATNVDNDLFGLVDCKNIVEALIANRNSPYDSFHLVVSNDSALAGASDAALQGLVRSFMGAPTAEVINADPAFGYSATCSGTFTWYATVEISDIQVRYHLPGSLTVERMVLPTQQPRMS